MLEVELAAAYLAGLATLPLVGALVLRSARAKRWIGRQALQGAVRQARKASPPS